MKHIAISLILVSVLTGCAAPRSALEPAAIQAMPNDCANRNAMINWLSQQAAIPKSRFEHEENYEQAQSQIRHRIWTIRYNCQPV
jgi:hypothetical protein